MPASSCSRLLGPALVLWSFGARFELGFDAPWYLAALLSVGYVPLPSFVVFLAWAAGGAQLAALAAGRYAPYPDARERGRRAGRSANSVRRRSCSRSAATAAVTRSVGARSA